MAKYKSLAAETLWVDVAGRLVTVEPGGIIEIPEGTYVQTGEHGETPIFEPAEVAVRKTKNEEK